MPLKAIVTSGPTRERIDPVRYISNDSSGKQGHAIAEALVESGFEVVLVSGPVAINAPDAVKLIPVESAEQMLEAVEGELPADIFISVAAVCDWRPEKVSEQKIKKQAGVKNFNINFVKNPDVLAAVSKHKNRPQVVVGFAAETEKIIENAKAKLQSKACDFILANDVSCGFGGDENQVSIINKDGEVEAWSKMSKAKIAKKLVNKLKLSLSSGQS